MSNIENQIAELAREIEEIESRNAEKEDGLKAHEKWHKRAEALVARGYSKQGVCVYISNPNLGTLNVRVWECSHCGHAKSKEKGLLPKYKFCPECGRLVARCVNGNII